MIKEITATELKLKKDNKEDFQLIDVREEFEFDIVNIGGELIPISDILDNVSKISKFKPVIFYCRSGARSANMVNVLERQFGFTNLYNLKGGIISYIDQIDPTLTKY